MKRRDLAWRGLGLGIVALAGAIGPGGGLGTGVGTGFVAFITALIGLVLLVQGKRVPAALRIERSRHRTLPEAIHRRVTRSDR